jgi:hypothetical protein
LTALINTRFLRNACSAKELTDFGYSLTFVKWWSRCGAVFEMRK